MTTPLAPLPWDDDAPAGAPADTPAPEAPVTAPAPVQAARAEYDAADPVAEVAERAHRRTGAATAEIPGLDVLPPSEALDAILGEQERFDAMLDDDPEELGAGELGRTPLERRASIPSLAGLFHRRRVIVRALAPLAAIFEGGQTPLADALRKQHRALISAHILDDAQARTEVVDKNGKPVETALERAANADPRHVGFVKRLTSLRTAYTIGRVALMEVNEEIRDREEALRAHRAEVNANIGRGEGGT